MCQQSHAHLYLVFFSRLILNLSRILMRNLYFFCNPPTRNPFQHDHSFRFGVGFGLEVLGITVKLRLMNVKLINLFYNCGPWKIRPLKLIELYRIHRANQLIEFRGTWTYYKLGHINTHIINKTKMEPETSLFEKQVWSSKPSCFSGSVRFVY